MWDPRKGDLMDGAEQPRIAFWGKNIADHYSSLAHWLATIDVPTKRYAWDPVGRTFSGLPESQGRKLLDLAYRAVTHPIVPNSLHHVGRLIMRVEAWLNVAHLARHHDVLVFGFGLTPTNTSLELALYRMLGKRIIAIFHGSDVRPPYLNEAMAPAGRPVEWEKLLRQTRQVAGRVHRFERFAHEVCAYPGVSHFFTREVVDWYRIGKPLTLLSDRAEPAPREETRGTTMLRVGHGPTRQSTKGTAEISARINELVAEGWQLEFIYPPTHIQKRELHQLLRACDLVIDQLWADVPGATLAAESIEMGIPVIVGVHDVALMTAWYPERARVMTFIDAESLKQTLIDVLESPAGAASLWKGNLEADQETIARRYLDVFVGRDAGRWRFDPKEVLGVFGFGPPRRIHEIAAGYVGRFGARSLMLDHRPELRQLIEGWAASGPSSTEEVDAAADGRTGVL